MMIKKIRDEKIRDKMRTSFMILFGDIKRELIKRANNFFDETS